MTRRAARGLRDCHYRSRLDRAETVLEYMNRRLPPSEMKRLVVTRTAPISPTDTYQVEVLPDDGSPAGTGN